MVDELSFAIAEARKGSPLTLHFLICNVFKANSEAAFKEARPYLMPPGVDGSPQFDNAAVVNILLRHDRELDGQVAQYMAENNISKRVLWDKIHASLKRAGFDMSHGRLYGLIENKEKRTSLEHLREVE